MNPSHEYKEYTSHDRECMRQHTEDEKQPILRRPASLGTEGKQQTPSKRSLMLCDQILDQPARMAIKVLLELRNGRSILARDSLSRDARIFLDRCRELRSLLQPTPRCTELEEYALGLSSMLVENYSKYIVHDLSYATRLKLAIIVWHFGDDPEPVRAFLRSPINKRVWENLYADYLTYSQQDIPYLTFEPQIYFSLYYEGMLRQLPNDVCEFLLSEWIQVIDAKWSSYEQISNSWPLLRVLICKIACDGATIHELCNILKKVTVYSHSQWYREILGGIRLLEANDVAGLRNEFKQVLREVHGRMDALKS